MNVDEITQDRPTQFINIFNEKYYDFIDKNDITFVYNKRDQFMTIWSLLHDIIVKSSFSAKRLMMRKQF